MENKRSRGIQFDDELSPDSTKRFRPDVLLEILDDDDSGVDSGVDCLADVMKSFEEEIALPSSSPAPTVAVQPDLGYLLEASDDELGLPPTVGSEGSDSSDGRDVIEIVDDEEPEMPGFGRIWGFEDEISDGYGCFGFGVSEVEESGFGFDGGLFDYSDVAGYGPYDCEELSWRTA